MASCWIDDQFSVPLDLLVFDNPPSTPTAVAAAKADLAVQLVRQANAQYVPFHLVVRAGDDIPTARMLAMPLQADRMDYLLGVSYRTPACS